MDEERLKNIIKSIVFLRAKAKGTSRAKELLNFSKEVKEMVASIKKAKQESISQAINTTQDYEIDPNKDLDEQIGIIIEGEMRDREKAKTKVKNKDSQMKVEPPVICSQCAHLNPVAGGKITCKGFPEGIPEIILSGDHDHRTLLPDQKTNIRFNKLYRIDPRIDIID